MTGGIDYLPGRYLHEVTNRRQFMREPRDRLPRCRWEDRRTASIRSVRAVFELALPSGLQTRVANVGGAKGLADTNGRGAARV